MATKRLVIELDEDDFRDIQREFASRQVTMHRGFDLPEGDSCLRGAMLGEIVRDLWEYRAAWEAEHPRGEHPT